MQELILVVDDEPKVVQLARDYLERNGFRVLSASDGPTALAMARRERPDLIVLDLLLPGLDGRDVCRILRRETEIPILMLTALSEENDQIVGLELGADDYITKPFSPRALVARVRAALRRAQGRLRTPSVLRSGGLEVNLDRHTVTLDGKPLHLTPNEFKLLSLLVRHPGQTLTREQMADELHGLSFPGLERSIDSHIKNLRRKLENAAAQAGGPDPKPLIETIYGVGYRLLDQD